MGNAAVDAIPYQRQDLADFPASSKRKDSAALLQEAAVVRNARPMLSLQKKDRVIAT